MLTREPAQIRTLLYSGSVSDIGPRADSNTHTPSTLQVTLGFAAIYLIWGSTYLGIRYAVETIPPLLMMAIRHSVAGALVYGWARWRGAPPPTLKRWRYALIAGAFLFLLGHGVLAWAEQKIPSGLAALLCATLPLWTVLLGRIRGSEKQLAAKTYAGILLGFAGVALLIGPDAFRHSERMNLVATAAAMFSSFSWAVGTIYSKGIAMPKSTVLAASMQMFAGGMWLFLAGVLSGEGSRLHLASISAKSMFALLYLIVFGSIVAFTAFTWLLSVASPSRVSTYAYVNPVVAVFIGWALAAEPIGVHTIAATVVIVAGVFLVITRTKVDPERGEVLEEKRQGMTGSRGATCN